MANGTSLGDIYVALVADASAYERAFKRAEATTDQVMGNIGRAIKLGAAASAAAIAGLSTLAVREYAKFDEAMAKSLSAMDGVNAETRKQLADTAREVAKHSTTSAAALAEGYGALEDAGYNAQQAVQALATVEQFAHVNTLDMATATQQLTQAQSALGMTSEDAAKNGQNLLRISDALTQAGNVGKGSTTQYAEALNAAAGTMKYYNISLEEGLATMAAFSDAGVRGGEAGQTYVAILKTLQKAAGDNKEEWKQMGIAVYDAQGNLRPVGDVLSELNTNLAGTSDQNKRATLEMLGFENRVIAQVQPLLGVTGAIKGYQKAMEGAGGATKEVAERQLDTFNAQAAILVNNVKDALITIGEQLMPILKTINEYFKDVSGSTQDWGERIQFVADICKTALLVAVSVVLDTIRGWQLVIKGGQVAFSYAFELILAGAAQCGKGVEWVIQKLVDGINLVIRASNASIGKLKDSLKMDEVKFGGFEAVKDLQNWADGAAQSTAELKEEFFQIIDKGKPSEEFIKKWEEVSKKVQEIPPAVKAIPPAAQAVVAPVVAATNQVREVYTKTSAEVIKLREAIRYPWQDGLRELEKYKLMLKDGAITQQEFNDAVHKLGLNSDIEDPMEKALYFVQELKARMDAGTISAQEYQYQVQQALGNASQFINPMGPGAPGVAGPGGAGNNQNQTPSMYNNFQTGIGDVDTMNQYTQEENALQKSYDRQLAITNAYYEQAKLANKQNTTAIEQERIRITREMETNYNAMRENYAAQRNRLLLSSSASTFDSLASIAEAFGGKQSGVYKGLFAASKAFAIAESIVAIQQGIANAVKLGWPAMIPAIASVAAASANIVSNIQAVRLSFEGGGHTGYSPRSGGLDGKGGFMAMLHPQERVIDEYQGQDANSGGGGVKVIVNNYSDSQASVTQSEDGKTYEVLIQKATKKIATDIRTGKGEVTSAMQDTYKLSRGK